MLSILRIKLVFLAVILGFGLIACHQKTDPKTIIVGTIAGPETELVAAAKPIALQDFGLTIKIIEFNDYNLPNAALDEGSLDANVYQHTPYLNASLKAHKYQLEVIGKTFVYPMGIYSKNVRNIHELKENSLIALPNDPSNEARALLLLQSAGLITLQAQEMPSIKDITSNPKKLRFKEMDAAQLPRILPDVDAALINTTFAIPAGLSPAKDAIYLENKDSPYANLIVINKNSAKKEQLELLVKALQSDPVKEKAKELFGDGAIEAW